MRIKVVNRFYCDYCSKGMLVRASMKRHEEACIKNPLRVCPVCAEFNLEQVPMPRLLAAEKDGIEALKSVTECPCCILSALCLARLANPHGEWVEFNYKTELRDLRSEQL